MRRVARAGVWPETAKSPNTYDNHVLMIQTLRVTETRRPLGVLTLNATPRDGAQAPGNAVEPEPVRWLEGLDRAGPRAAACLWTRVITVCDREGDLWERFEPDRASGADLLVRSDRGRQRRVLRRDGTTENLWEAVAKPSVLDTKILRIRSCGPPSASRAPGRPRTPRRRRRARAVEGSGRPDAGAHACRRGPGTLPAPAPRAAPRGAAHHRGQGRPRPCPTHRRRVGGALDPRRVLPGPQGRGPDRGPQVPPRRRPAQSARHRCRDRRAGHGPRAPRPRPAPPAGTRFLHDPGTRPMSNEIPSIRVRNCRFPEF